MGQMCEGGDFPTATGHNKWLHSYLNITLKLNEKSIGRNSYLNYKT